MSDQEPCEGCPFKDVADDLKQKAVEGDDCEMLCHESRCLDGDRPDRLCVGFYGREGVDEP